MKTKIIPKTVLITFLVSMFISACTSFKEPLPIPTAQNTPVPATPTLEMPTKEVPDQNGLPTPFPPVDREPIDMTPISPADLPENLQPVVQQAISELAESLSINTDQILLLSAQSVVWSDSSLGCPQPGMNYLQVLTDGYRVILAANDAQYDYHANKRGYGIFCENPSPPYSDGAVDR
jgi:hypothetical protein